MITQFFLIPLCKKNFNSVLSAENKRGSALLVAFVIFRLLVLSFCPCFLSNAKFAPYKETNRISDLTQSDRKILQFHV